MDTILYAVLEYLFFRVGAAVLNFISFGRLIINEKTAEYWKTFLVAVFGFFCWGIVIFMMKKIFEYFH